MINNLKVIGDLTQCDVIKAKIDNLMKEALNNSTRDSGEYTALTMLKDELQKEELSFIGQQELEYLRKNPEEKWIEYLVYRYQFKNNAIKKIRPQFPLYLLIEPTSACNLHCKMCWHSDKSFTSNKDYIGFMDFDLFKKVVDEAVEKGTKALTMASRGEPTLHPNLGKMLQYCAGKFLEVKINTNAVHLNEELIHQILKSNIDLVVFSIDDYTKEGYASIRMKDCFEKVLSNMYLFHKIRKEHYPTSKTTTRIHGVRVNPEMDEHAFLTFWNDRCDQASLCDCHNRWDLYNNALSNVHSPCDVLYDRMYVWHDGKCNPCDPDYKSTLCIGNVTEQTIEEVWNGEAYKKLIDMHLNNQRKDLEPCNRCDL